MVGEFNEKQKVENFCPAWVSGGISPEIMRQSLGAGPKSVIRAPCPQVKLANDIPPRKPFC
jgi:hypothetical protein